MRYSYLNYDNRFENIYTIFNSLKLYIETKPKCYGPHEIYSTCENNDCQRTCESVNSKKHCNAVCIPGCICGPGFYRNKKGICVMQHHCGEIFKPFL